MLKICSFILQVIERKRRAEQARLQYERELEEQKSGSLYFKKWCEAKRFPFYGMRNEQSVLFFFMDACCCVWCGVDGVGLLVWGGESSSVGEGQEGDVSSHALSWKLMDTLSPCITVVLDLHNAASLFALMNCQG